VSTLQHLIRKYVDATSISDYISLRSKIIEIILAENSSTENYKEIVRLLFIDYFVNVMSYSLTALSIIESRPPLIGLAEAVAYALNTRNEIISLVQGGIDMFMLDEFGGNAQAQQIADFIEICDTSSDNPVYLALNDGHLALKLFTGDYRAVPDVVRQTRNYIKKINDAIVELGLSIPQTDVSLDAIRNLDRHAEVHSWIRTRLREHVK